MEISPAAVGSVEDRHLSAVMMALGPRACGSWPARSAPCDGPAGKRKSIHCSTQLSIRPAHGQWKPQQFYGVMMKVFRYFGISGTTKIASF